MKQQLDALKIKASKLEQKIQSDTEQFQILNSEIQKVKEAEAFMTQKHERALRKQKLEETKAAQSQCRQAIQKLDEERNHIFQIQAVQQHELAMINLELEFYKELGKRKEKFDQLRKLSDLENEKKKEIKHLNAAREELELKIDEQGKQIRKLESKLDTTNDQIEDINRNTDSTQKQQNREQDRLETYQAALVKTMQQIQEMQNLAPDLYAEFSASFEKSTHASEVALNKQLENGMVKFDNARHQEGIDPAAEDNYRKAKEEFERLETEYQQSKILLENDKERTAKLKEDLETTINMRVLEINKRFAVYMAAFQFQGEISWDPREDKKGRTHFHLYLKARKEGHRGTMEDVSVKARGGRVGKGVSGGEESLSSLLFALALLQNLETTPGFIVLDEFDSALDEQRKSKVFDLYVEQLKRKLIILTPKTHEAEYVNRFKIAFVVQHDPSIPKSKVTGIRL
ncbi:SMC domain protein [Heyndrickxia coagulans 2-6]|nr:SMC domain protein [Heyndrickxia coagulans 2-6]